MPSASGPTDQRVDLVTGKLTALAKRCGHALDFAPVATHQPFGLAPDWSQPTATAGKAPKLRESIPAKTVIDL